MAFFTFPRIAALGLTMVDVMRPVPMEFGVLGLGLVAMGLHQLRRSYVTV